MKKQFKTESKKMLDMMINSIYTHKEIFLRELISNASDAIDKRYYRSLTDPSLGLEKDDYRIFIARDKDARTLTVTDNGCGMTSEELEKNLGTIAKSGSGEFKKDNKQPDDISVIGQFGVGFYSAFMVADRITVRSRALGSDTASIWESEGVDGYTIKDCDYSRIGTEIIIHLKADSENEKYSDFLEEYKLRELIKKYSDYIHYPIVMETEDSKLKEGTGVDGKDPEYETVTQLETMNSMIPLWHRKPSEITADEYNGFYTEKFYDYTAPAKVIHFRTEGTVTYEALLYVPAKAPFNYYSKNFEKGLRLYSNGVMITDKCEEMLPDYFSFVRGLVDSPDFTLNISRETLQHDHQLKAIAKNVEKKIKNELAKMLESDREKYEDFFKEFGLQLKYGLYSDYGMHKDVLSDLLLFKSSFEKKYVTLKEYVSRMPEDQKKIYYACADTVDSAELLPQTEAVRNRGYEVLYFTDDVDEFTIQTLFKYSDKEFANVSSESADLSTDEEKEAIKKENDGSKDLLTFIKESIGDGVSSVRFTSNLGSHPICLSSEGGISTEMEKVLGKMPGNEAGFAPKAETVLEINLNHPIADTMKKVYAEDHDKAAKYSKVLYAQARLICGLPIQNPSELSSLICDVLSSN
ncbi:MAG: molecular chaperone HtpG [Clostridia bacterium]|nr:molecular chaperone HtpG [Clostridia bacterium]